MRSMIYSCCAAVLVLAAGQPAALASPLAQSDGVTAAVPPALELAQMYYDDDDRRRDRRRARRDRDSRGGGDGVYRGGRGDGVYRGDRGGSQGTVFCNPQLGCVRDLNMTPGAGLGGR
jgi:hypothetical protein